MVKAVLFDLDGTLLNTSPDICKVLNDTFASFQLPPVSLSDTIAWVGGGVKKLLERAIPPSHQAQFNAIYTTFCKLYAESKNELTCLYPDEAEVLTALKQQGVKLAILTNKPQAATDGVYQKHLACFGFDVVLGESERFPIKPNPASCHYVLEQLGVSKEECVLVGDGEADVLTAQNAGIRGIAALWGYRSQSQLAACGARTFAESYIKLKSLLFT